MGDTGLHIISTVTTAAHDMGISPAFSAKRPVDDFMLRFQTVCEMLDEFAKVEHPNAGRFDVCYIFLNS